MNKRIAMKWAKALESGKYKQTKGRLKDEVGYCCLGVLCEISGLAYDGGRGALPWTVQDWAEIRSEIGAMPFDPMSRHKALTSLNDGIGYSFKEIAKVIRRYWKEL